MRAKLAESESAKKQDIINNLTARISLLTQQQDDLRMDYRRQQDVIDDLRSELEVKSSWPDWIWYCIIAGCFIIMIGIFRIYLFCRDREQKKFIRESKAVSDQVMLSRAISEGISSLTVAPPLKMKSLNNWKSIKMTRGSGDDYMLKKESSDELWRDGDEDGIETVSTNTIAETLKDETNRDSNDEGYLKHMTSII